MAEKINYNLIQSSWLNTAKQMLILSIVLIPFLIVDAYNWRTGYQTINLMLLISLIVLLGITLVICIKEYLSYWRLKVRIKAAKPQYGTIVKADELEPGFWSNRFMYTCKDSCGKVFYILAPFSPYTVVADGQCKNLQVRYVDIGRHYFDFPRENI